LSALERVSCFPFSRNQPLSTINQLLVSRLLDYYLLMKSRIRGAAVIVHENQIAFARHSDSHRDLAWWSPPGGSVEGEETILVSAEREALEETSLFVMAERPIYAQELIDHRRKSRTLELFILCRLAEGVSPDDIRPDN